MKKYDVHFCECGTVHFCDENLQDSVFFDESGRLMRKELVQVCLHCGKTIISGLNETNYDSDDMPSYDQYLYELRETMENPNPEKYYVILSKGVRVMMQSGGYADGFRGNLYVDEDSLVREIGSSDLNDIEGVNNYFINKDKKYEYRLRDVRAVNVDMKRLLQDITPDQAESMCGFYIKSFNWVGTPHEKDIHR